MKKSLLLLAVAVLALAPASYGAKKNKAATKTSVSNAIATPTPARAAGQKDALQLAVAPIKTVRIAFIGIGMRGSEAVRRVVYLPNVEVVALCDVVEANVKKANDYLEKNGFPKAQEFYGDTEVYKKVTALPNVDLVYIATDWKHHATVGLQAMKDGKHAAIEVPSAMTMEEIWALIDMAEQKRLHCIPLENCVYDDFELTTLNMAQQGIFGDILHAEGAYIHGLQPFWNRYWDNWRMDYNETHRGDLYPTHGLGPVCMALNMHRGDKMNYLVSVDTKAVGNPEFIKEKTGRVVTDFRNGDHTSTLISTEQRKSILIEHNVTSPRPYSRMYQLTGTQGFANKYPTPGLALEAGSIPLGEDIPIDKLSGHSFMPKEAMTAVLNKYKHPIMMESSMYGMPLVEKSKEVGGHGGMDFVMDSRMIYCLQNGLPMDMDVYDLAEWCCLIPLTEISLDNGSRPVEIPDFTRGAWNKLTKAEFHFAK